MTTWTPVGGTPVTWSVSPVEGILAATTISFTPAGVLSSTTVQDAITELATKSLLLSNAAAVATSGSGSDIQTGNASLNSLGFIGSVSGKITAQATTGTYNWNLPTTAGASGDFLTSAAGGSAAMTWTTPATVAKSGLASDLGGTQTAWTPVLTFATPGDLAVTYTTQFGRYVKLSNNMLLVQFVIVTSAFTFTTASGNLQITGLPFTAQNTTGLNARGALSFGGINKTSYSQVVVGMAPNASLFVLNASGMGVAATAVTATDTPTGGTINLSAEIVIFL